MEKLQGKISEALKQSINTEKAIHDCVNFDFDVKVFKVQGQFCKPGFIDITVSFAGIQIEHEQIDLSKGESCNTKSIGVEEVQYCFYLKDSCLYTKGYIDGWLHSKQTWDEKIICI